MTWMPGETNWGAVSGIGGMILVGVGAMVYMTIKDVKDFNRLEGKTYSEKVESFMLREERKQSVIKYIDKDSNGLSFSEDYKIKELMGV